MYRLNTGQSLSVPLFVQKIPAAGKGRQIHKIGVRRRAQPGLIGFPAGVEHAYGAVACRRRGFQGVETVLKDERFRRRGVQGLGGQQVNCRLMLADADLCRSEKPGEIPFR